MKCEFSKLKAEIAVIFILFLSVILFFPELLNTNEKYFFRDFHHSIYPMKHFLAQSVASGSIPWWNPYVSCGTPFMANVQSGLLYPPNILFYVLPFKIAMNAFIFIHIYFALFFMYLFLRMRKHSRELAIFGAFIFGFAGINVSLINLLIALQAAVWTPLILLFWLTFLEKKDIKYLVFSSIAVALQFLGAAPVLLISTLVFTFFYGISLKKCSFLKYLASYAWMGGISLLLSAVQLLPTLQMAQNSTRAVIKAPLKWSLNPEYLQDFLIPRVFFPENGFSAICFPSFSGEFPWLISIYLGFLVLLLVVYRIVCMENRKNLLFLTSLLGLFFFLAFGKNISLVNKILTLDIFNNVFKIPEKFLCIIVFIVAILAVEGLSAYKAGSNRSWFLPLAMGLSAIIVLVVAFSCHASTSTLSELFTAKLFRLVAIIGLNFFLLLLFQFSFLSKKGLILLMSVSLFMEYSLVTGQLNPTVPNDFYTSPPQITKYLDHSDSEKYRIHYCVNSANMPSEPMLTHLSMQRVMIPNTNTAFKYQSSVGSEAIEQSKTTFLSFIACQTDNVKWKVNILKNMNCKYLVSGKNIKDSELKKKATIGVWNVYEIVNPVPRVFVTGKVDTIPVNQMAFKMAEIDLRDKLLLSDSEQLEDYHTDNSGKVEIVDYKNDKVVINTDLSCPGYLVLLDTNYPGWKALVNGEEKEILSAYETFRAVKVEKGKSEIVFKYEENSFKIGLSLSFLGVFLSILSLFLKRFVCF